MKGSGIRQCLLLIPLRQASENLKDDANLLVQDPDSFIDCLCEGSLWRKYDPGQDIVGHVAVHSTDAFLPICFFQPIVLAEGKG